MGVKVKRELIEYRFYNDEIVLQYDPIEHLYLREKEGVLVPQDGVTTVVKIIDKSSVLINWAVKIVTEKILASVVFPITSEELTKLVISAKSAHRERLEDAGNIGKLAHSWIEEYIIKFLINQENPEEYSIGLPLDEKAAKCCQAALSWMSAHDVRWICTERKIYSQKHEYAGTLDGVALVNSCQDKNCCPVEFEDRRSLIDWKTSNHLYNEYLFQTAAYLYAYEEETREKIEDRWIIRLGKDDGVFDSWHVGMEDFDLDFRAFLSCLSLTRDVKDVNLRMKDREKRKKLKSKGRL